MRTTKISRVRRAPRLRPQVANLEERVLLDAAGGSMQQSRFQALQQRRQMLIQRMEARRIARLQHLGITYQGSLTYQYNQMRTGLNTSETTLTPANVNNATFGKLGSYHVDGLVYAQPLYVSGVQRHPGRGVGQNLVIVATENDSVYAIDPNHPYAGPQHNGVVWQTSFVNPSQGITPVKSADIGAKDIVPIVGITSTPVLDPNTGLLYVTPHVEIQQNPGSPKTYVYEIAAIDVASGRTVLGPQVISATTVQSDGSIVSNGVSVPGTGSGSVNGVVTLDAYQALQRPGLVLDTNVPGHPQGVIFAAFGSTHDQEPYHGWVVGYDAATLQLFTVFNDTPNGYGGRSGRAEWRRRSTRRGTCTSPRAMARSPPIRTNTRSGAVGSGLSDMGLGYGGIPNSAAVMFSPIFPSNAHNSTGLYYNGVRPRPEADGSEHVSQPRQLRHQPQLGAQDQAGQHTFQATLYYDGSTLTETIQDTATHAGTPHVQQREHASGGGGNMAYVGFGGSNGARQVQANITSWTYSTNGSTVIDHSSDFASHWRPDANGRCPVHRAVGSMRRCPAHRATHSTQTGTIFSQNQVNISHFTTTFSSR